MQVVDGHKVIINDTVYSKKTDFGETIFKVRTIDVRPLDDDESATDANVPEAEAEPEATTFNVKSDDDDDDTNQTPKNDVESTETSDEGGAIGSADIDAINTGSPEVFDTSSDNEIPKNIDELEVKKNEESTEFF